MRILKLMWAKWRLKEAISEMTHCHAYCAKNDWDIPANIELKHLQEEVLYWNKKVMRLER